jgi:hypothetical protein
MTRGVVTWTVVVVVVGARVGSRCGCRKLLVVVSQLRAETKEDADASRIVFLRPRRMDDDDDGCDFIGGGRCCC